MTTFYRNVKLLIGKLTIRRCAVLVSKLWNEAKSIGKSLILKGSFDSWDTSATKILCWARAWAMKRNMLPKTSERIEKTMHCPRWGLYLPQVNPYGMGAYTPWIPWTSPYGFHGTSPYGFCWNSIWKIPWYLLSKIVSSLRIEHSTPWHITCTNERALLQLHQVTIKRH